MKDWTPIFIENSRIPRLLSYFSPINIGAIALGVVVFCRGSLTPTTKQHETIHFQQFLETLFIGFFILYVYDYIKNCIKFKNRHIAYYNIRAEKEAYSHEETPNYLQTRKRWNWIKWK